MDAIRLLDTAIVQWNERSDLSTMQLCFILSDEAPLIWDYMIQRGSLDGIVPTPDIVAEARYVTSLLNEWMSSGV